MSNYHEQQYLDALKDILGHGDREPNRTGIDTLTVPGMTLQFDLREGFPAVTTKKLAWKQVVGELIGFLRGCDEVADFHALGCTIWDQNAYAKAWVENKNRITSGDLGRIYGVQWRDWRGVQRNGLRTEVDQLAIALNTLRNNPESRRIIVNSWNAAEIDQAALPPCHVLFQLLPRSDGTLHMTMYQRSCDMFLGVPFNIASYAVLLELFAAWSGRKAATLTMFLADAHIYVNHIEQVRTQISRTPKALPKLGMRLPHDVEHADLDELLDWMQPEHFTLIDYEYHPAIKADMAV
jgi:thymidylate synthase